MRRFVRIPPFIPLLLLSAFFLLVAAPFFTNLAHGTSEPGQQATSTAPGQAEVSPNQVTPSPHPAKCGSKPRYLALTSTHKNSPHAFGNPISETDDTSTYWNKLRDYVYTDPAGAAAFTAAFDNDYGHVNDRIANYIDGRTGRDMWCEEVNRALKPLINASINLMAIPKGAWSLYMVKGSDGDTPVEIRQGTTAKAGTAVVFNFDNRSIVLLLNCHFQPTSTDKLDNVETVPSGNVPSTPEAKQPSQDPASQGNADTGGGTNDDSGPGRSVAPSDVPTVPESPRVNPAPPS